MLLHRALHLNIYTFIGKMLVLLLLSVTWAVANAQECPQQYARFSAKHSYCLPPNPTCQVLHSGMTKEDREVILKVHNNFRSKVATGKELEAGGLPTASDMMEMDWDDELESIAQKWAAQCLYEHDCNDCRGVENFGVGQNLAYEDVVPACSDNTCWKPDWEKMIDMFYNEVEFFNNQLIKSFKMDGKYGHFTQIVWAKTWKIGCGYIVYRTGYGLRKMYNCNYGPASNTITESMYKAGKPCSQCPSNTCCGNCESSSYDGLCQVMNKKQGPVYNSSNENSLIDCNWKTGEPTCNFKVDGQQNWSLKPTFGGYYYSILLKGGEKSSLKLMKSIKPMSESFCMVAVIRKNPIDAKQGDSSTILVEMDLGRVSTRSLLRSDSVQFVPYSMDLTWNYKTKVTFTFSVPPNASDHIIDIKEVYAYEGKCSKN